MNDKAQSDMAQPSFSAPAQKPFRESSLIRFLALGFFLYAFMVSIGMLGAAFKGFGGGVVGGLIESASNPLIGLFVGILVTSLVQSSSTTTSLVVAMVAGGTMEVATAIPVIMGANIGTSVTCVLVSLGHLTRGQEFRRAFAAATVHDFFNLLAVAIIFPLQYFTDFLGIASQALSQLFQNVGGFSFASPLKLITAPVVKGSASLLGDSPWLLLIVSLVVMFLSLRYLVIILKGLVLTKIEALFDRLIFRNAARAMLFGLLITALVQSSSVTTSLAVPLAGAGILTLHQILPYTLGANVGTTVTAMLAALAVGEISGLTVAFAHLLFNVSGIVIIWPLRQIRELPIRMAKAMTDVAMRGRWIPIVWIALLFYVIPLLLILVMR